MGSRPAHLARERQGQDKLSGMTEQPCRFSRPLSKGSVAGGRIRSGPPSRSRHAPIERGGGAVEVKERWADTEMDERRQPVADHRSARESLRDQRRRRRAGRDAADGSGRMRNGQSQARRRHEHDKAGARSREANAALHADGEGARKSLSRQKLPGWCTRFWHRKGDALLARALTKYLALTWYPAGLFFSRNALGKRNLDAAGAKYLLVPAATDGT